MRLALDLGLGRGLVLVCALWGGLPSARAAATEANLNLDFLESKILTSGPNAAPAQRVADFLGQLPPELRRNYVLMQRSRSLQFASPKFPRVLMHSKIDSGYLMVAFNGRPGERGYGDVEAIEFHADTNQYEFRRFRFPEGGVLSQPRVERNPAICLSCHGKEGKPILEPYPLWPGAIGEREQPTEAELKQLKDFVASGAQSDRYATLLRQENLQAILDDPLGLSPVFSLDLALSDQKVQILVDGLQKSPDYAQYKYILFSALAQCANISELLPPGLSWGTEDKLAAYLADTKAKYSRLLPAHLKLLSGLHGDAGHVWIARLRWLTESRGLSLGRMGNSLQSPYLFDPSTVDVQQVLSRLAAGDRDFEVSHAFVLQVLANEFAEVSLYDPSFSPRHEEMCRQLKQKSLKAFALGTPNSR